MPSMTSDISRPPLTLTPRADPDLLSFVIPMYNEAEVLPALIHRLELLAS